MNSLCKAWWSIYFSWLGCRAFKRRGVFHFQVLVADGILYLFHSQTSTTVYLAQDRALEQQGNFPINIQSNRPMRQKQVCIWNHKHYKSAACWLVYKPTIRSGSSDRLLFYCIFIWYHLSVGGTISDRRTLNHINKIKWIPSKTIYKHTYWCII